MKTILCILAGGRSSRFGSSKLCLRVNGQPVLGWLAQRLRRPCWQRWLSVAPGAGRLAGSAMFDRVIVDRTGFAGPLAAMGHVLASAPPRSVVIFAAADMPFVEPEHVHRLLLELRRIRQTAVMTLSNTLSGGAHVEPLPSVWRAGRGARMIARALSLGVRGPHRLADWPGVELVGLGGSAAEQCFANINRREDMSTRPELSLPV